MAITQVTVTGTFQRAPGQASIGSLSWQLSTPLFYGGVPVANTAPIAVTLDANGSFSVPLWAVDDTLTLPTGAYWTMRGLVDGQAVVEHYVIGRALAPSVDISTLTPTSPSLSAWGYATIADVNTILAGLVGEIDGGSAASTFLVAQSVDGGTA